MALVTHTLEGMYNGVSQQPAPLRLDNQFSKQINFTSNVVDGITKRPNSEFVSILDVDMSDNAVVHNVNQSLEDRYKIIFTGLNESPIEIVDLNGNKFDVSYETPEVKEYVTAEKPQKHIKTLPLSDLVLINNNTVTVKESYVDAEAILNRTCMVYVKHGLPEIEYTVELFDKDGESLGSATVEKEPSENLSVRTVKTDEIADELTSKLNVLLDSSDYIVETLGSTIVFQYVGTDRAWDEVDIKVEVQDSFGDTALIPINQTVGGFDELPNKGIDHYPIAVTGDRGTEDGAFYLEYDSDEELWRETRAILGTEGQYLADKLDADTMPKALERNADGSFTVKNIEWEHNTVGDEITSPMPSFVDKEITNIFFYRSRIGFLCEDNIIFSKNNDFFNLFPKTASSVLFDDPIDIEVASNQVVNLKNALTYNKSLVVFSEQAQFVVGATAEVLTPETITVDTSTHFESLPDCEPVQAGSNIFFPVSKGNFTAVREYFVRTDSIVDDAQDITSHISSYIPEDVFKMQVSSAFDTLFLVSNEDPNTLYVYRYLSTPERKVQSAWFKWTFDAHEKIIDISMANNWLYMITNNSVTGETHLKRIDLRRIKTGDLPIKIYLDNLTTVEGEYDSLTRKTTFELPYATAMEDGNILELVDTETGLALNRVTQTESGVLEVVGDYSEKVYYVGRPFSSLLEYSQFYLKNRQQMPDIQGKLQLKTLTLAFSETGEFKLNVLPNARNRAEDIIEEDGDSITFKSHDVIESVHSGIVLGESVIGNPPIITGEHTFPVTVNAKKARIYITADNYLPANFQLTAFEAEYNNRAKYGSR